MPRSFIVALTLLVIVLSCSACGMLPPPPPAFPGMTPPPESPTGTPPGNSEPSIPTQPTPAPDGIMPSVLAEINLGPAAGNGFQPVAFALDETQQAEDQRAFVICERSDRSTGQSCIVQIDLATRTVLDLWLLSGRSAGPLAAGGGRVYAVYRDQSNRPRLTVLDARTGQLRGDIDVATINPWQMALDIARTRLYLVGDEQVEVRDIETLEVVGRLPYPFRATDRQAAFDLEADRLYLSLSSVLYAYRASDLHLLWTREAPTHRIVGLLVDASGELLLAQAHSEEQGQAVRRVLLYTSAGEPAGEVIPQGLEGEWQAVWADAGRIIYQETVYLAQGTRARLWGSDLAGQVLGDPLPLPGGSRVHALPRARDLYILNRVAHTVTPVQAASLELQAAIPLGVELCDLVIDHDRTRLYVNDTAFNLYAVDLRGMGQGALTLERSVPAGSGELVLDGAGGTLLVSRYAGDQDRVAVLDPASLRVTQVITGGDLVALDTRRGRAIVSTAANLYPPFEGRATVWDLARRELVGVINAGGKPAYNPLRDEVYLAGYSCHAYGADTLERVGSLTPDIDAQTCRGCTGQLAVVDVGVYPALNALVLYTTVTSAGKGLGDLPLPRTLALDTLEPISHTLTILPACCGEYLVYPPANGRVYEQMHYSRYITRSNLVVRQEQNGEVISQRDGLSLELLIPDSGLAFVERGKDWLALDTASWTPVGYTRRFPIHSYDEEMQRFFVLDGSWLRVLLPYGGERMALETAQSAQPRSAIRALGAARADAPLFAITGEGVYRRQAEGAGWELLAGGLPDVREASDAQLVMAMSPTFTEDRTLFVGGWVGEHQGLGVWRSTDGGDTWQPAWQGLEHLRVESLVLSPDYGRDQTLLAYCQYSDLIQGETGRSVWKSVDGGGQWALLAQVPDTQAATAQLPQAADVWGQAIQQATVRGAKGNRVIERGAGEEWQEVLKLASRERLVSVEYVPESAAERAVYALSTLGLYRSVDEGTSWQTAALPVSVDPDGRHFTALEVAVDSEGQLVAWLGDSLGEVYSFRADELVWEAIP